MSPCTSREGVYCDSIDRVRGFRTLQEKAGAGGRRAAVSQDTTKAVVWRPTSTLSSPAPKQSGNTRATCRGVVDKFGGSGFVATATNQFGCGFVLDTKFGPRYDVTQPLWNLTGRLRLEVCRSNDFTSTTTHFVLSQGDLRQCCHRKLASSCSQTLDSGTPVVFVVVGRAKKSRLLRRTLSRPGLCRIILSGSPCRKRTLFLVWKCGQQRDLHRIARTCA